MAALLPYLDDEVRTLEATMSSDEGVHLSIPVKMTKAALCWTEDLNVDFVVAQHWFTVNGQPVATLATVRRIFSLAVYKARTTLPRADCRRRVVALMRRAGELEDVQLLSQLRIVLDNLMYGEYAAGETPTQVIAWATAKAPRGEVAEKFAPLVSTPRSA